VVDITLHIQDRYPAGFGNIVQVFIAYQPVAMTDGDAIKITAEDLTDLFGSITMCDLGGSAFNKSPMSTQLCNTGFK
jgi:hypothetical protein